ncbi:hypothetical protein SPHINGO391_480101 [Sphingomonas aurantiaca]|uniref:SGNH hydrolase-type esterase domain-containing protein n=2 Tax=Sphingomonas aurantiaca TaxID=185949 RepID=A0A5E8A0F5_9SPHN|nr:hypothetical protein SPHINGO391_480101 [Sphingomonas aurantiaca]
MARVKASWLGRCPMIALHDCRACVGGATVDGLDDPSAKLKLTVPCQRLGMSCRQTPNDRTPRLIKLLVGLGVFVAVLTGWNYLRPWVVNHIPLPDSVAASDARRCGIWFIGSSSIAKWRTLDRDFPGWQVHRRGIDGARISQIAARALRTNSEVAPAALLFYVGENDIAFGASGIATAQKVARLVGEMRVKWPSVPIFVISMKPSPERWPQRNDQLRYDNAIARLIRVVNNATFINSGRYLIRNGRPDSALYADTIHLNTEGYALWSIDIREAINRSMSLRRIASCQSKAQPS